MNIACIAGRRRHLFEGHDKCTLCGQKLVDIRRGHALARLPEGAARRAEKPITMREDPFVGGHSARGRGMPRSANPHEAGGEKHQLWDNGWLAGEEKAA